MFKIHLGIPEMVELWNRLEDKHRNGKAGKAEEKLRKVTLSSFGIEIK